MKEKVKREIKRLEEVFEDIEISIPNKSTLCYCVKDLLDFARAYFEDAKYFYEREKYLEAFELLSYVWGILDAMARMGLIVPKKTKKYFKIDQD